MNRRLALLVLVAPLSSACASLSVSVDVYKHPLPVSSVEVEPVARALVDDPRLDLQKSEARYRDFAGRLAAIVNSRNAAALLNEKTSLGNPISEEVATRTAERLWKATEANLASSWRDVKQSAAALHSAAFALIAPDRAAGSGVDVSRLVQAFSTALVEYESAQSKMELQVEVALHVAPEKLNAVLSDLSSVILRKSELRGIAASARLDSPVLGVPLFDDRISLLDRSSPTSWVDFGRLSFKTSGGSSQFVVVREGLVVFHQKSLDFDPSSVIAAGSALTEAGLKVAAAVASGQMIKPATGQSDTAKSGQTTTDRLVNEAEVEANRDLLARRVQARKETLLGLAQTFADLKKAGEKGITDDQIKQFLSEFQGQLDLYRAKSAKPEGSQ